MLVWFLIHTKRLNVPNIILCIILFVVAISINPIAQIYLFEPLDTHLNYQWHYRAKEIGLIGKTFDDIMQLYGNPICEWTETPRHVSGEGPAGTRGLLIAAPGCNGAWGFVDAAMIITAAGIALGG